MNIRPDRAPSCVLFNVSYFRDRSSYVIEHKMSFEHTPLLATIDVIDAVAHESGDTIHVISVIDTNGNHYAVEVNNAVA